MVKQAFENTLRGKRAAMSGTLPLSTRSSHPRAGIRLGAGLVWPELEPQKVLRKRDQRPGGTAAPSAAPGSGTGGASGADWLAHHHAFRLSVEKET